jgi:hypothetical protein
MTSLVHTDKFSFYTCAIISFLESRVSTYVDNLEPLFRCDAKTLTWLHETWLPEEAAHGRLMRSFVESTWPAEFSALYIPRCATEKLRPSVGLEALARCVTETQATMVYRCLASYTKDPDLKVLLKRMSADEARHFRKFKDLHLLHQSAERNSLLKRVRTLLARSELVRDEDLALAFAPLNGAWKCPPPFSPWSYAAFLEATAQVMKQHFPFKEAQRMLFTPLRTSSLVWRVGSAIIAKLVSRQFLRHAF